MSSSAEVQPPLRPVRDCKLQLPLRARMQPAKGVDVWREAVFEESLPTAEAALLLCDVWDDHPSEGAVTRLDRMIPTMNAVVGSLRDAGVQIIHAPSTTMDFYADAPQRHRMQMAPKVDPPEERDVFEPPLPIDDSDGGCDTGGYRPDHLWCRQHEGIEITEPDGISDDGSEVYGLFRQLGIRTMLIMGVHTNMCVLGRSFGVRQMTRWGIRVVLVRDMTDTMYNPAMAPYVSHDEGTQLVIEHIEKYWCPTVLSSDLLSQ